MSEHRYRSPTAVLPARTPAFSSQQHKLLRARQHQESDQIRSEERCHAWVRSSCDHVASCLGTCVDGKGIDFPGREPYCTVEVLQRYCVPVPSCLVVGGGGASENLK